MATELTGVITQVDDNGNEVELYPKTKLELVDGIVELTQAEYDALSETEKLNGNIYYIKDAGDDIDNKNAGAISYDNSTSGLEATNVQGAVDELTAETMGLKNWINTDYFNVKFVQDFNYTSLYDYIRDKYSSFRQGITVIYFQPNGAFGNAIVSKSTDSYGTVLAFGYNLTLQQYTINNGTWTTKTFQTT